MYPHQTTQLIEVLAVLSLITYFTLWGTGP